MAPNQKPVSAKLSQAIRRRYLWHLRPAFRSQFDNLHWWEAKSESKIDPAAALYELVRRHPLVREQWLRRIIAIRRNHRDLGLSPGHPFYGEAKISRIVRRSHWFQVDPKHPPPRSLYWTLLLGLTSWEQLSYTHRKNWQSETGSLKGLDFRWEELQCRSIIERAHWKIIDERKAALKKSGKIDVNTYDNYDESEAARKRNLNVLHEDLAMNPPTSGQWEEAIAYQAVESYREGRILLAVATDLKANKAKSVIWQKYRAHMLQYPGTKSTQRPRWGDWLPLISSFENMHKRNKAYSQTFARYRRALDGIRFT